MNAPPEQCGVAVYDSLTEARAAFELLVNERLAPDHASLIASGFESHEDWHRALQYGDETEKDAAVGAGVGGAVGLLAGATMMTLPAIGAVLVAGSIALGLTGAIVGGLLGAFAGWGVHKDSIEQYEQQLREGRVLVVVHGDPQQVARGIELLQQTEPHSLRTHARIGEDSPEVDDRI